MSRIRGTEVNTVAVATPATSYADSDPTVVSMSGGFTPLRSAPVPTAATVTPEYQSVLMSLTTSQYGQLGEIARSHNIAFTDDADLASKIEAIAEAEVVSTWGTKLQRS